MKSEEVDELELKYKKKKVQKILSEYCDEAFKNGINSVDIYKTLCQFPEDLLSNSSSSSSSSYSNSKLSKNKRLLSMVFTTIKILFKILIYLLTFGAITTISSLFLYYNFKLDPMHVFSSLSHCIIPSHPIIMEVLRPLVNCSSICSDKNATVIEFTNLPTKDNFLSIAYSSKPIIIRNVKGHKAKSTFNQIKEIFESEKGGIEVVSEECQFLPFRSKFLSLKDAFEKISQDSYLESPWYIGWSNCHPGVAEKLRKAFPRPNILPDEKEGSSSSAIDWIFIGSPNHGASMHMDYVKRPSWQLQLSGIKKWFLRPPPECEHVCSSDEISFTIKTGDLLFLETNIWYHSTLILGDELSISLGSEYD